LSPSAFRFRLDPFEKIVEWLDLQESIEGDSLFPILRLKPAAARPPFLIAVKAGMTKKGRVDLE
jgi:hypothetical protein